MGQLVRAVAASRKATELFKTLRTVRVELNPFDHRSTTAREFVRRVGAPTVKRANKGLKVELSLVEEYGRPLITLEYADGFEQKIEPAGLKIVDILEEVERGARWRAAEGGNPFEVLRRRRAKQLGLE